MKGRLLPQVVKGRIEAGCEKGRGSSGPAAAAVVLDPVAQALPSMTVQDGVSTASASRRD